MNRAQSWKAFYVAMMNTNGFALIPQKAVAKLLSMQQLQRVPWQDSLVCNQYNFTGDEE